MPRYMMALGRAVLADAMRRRSQIAETTSHLLRTMNWLARAQDATADGGVSEGLHLVHGWLPSYPETTGYIIETFLDYATLVAEEKWRDRALRMADWLAFVQDADGAVRDASLRNKMVFDTGQAIFGFVRAYRESGSGRFLDAAQRAGEWLCKVRDPTGPWIAFAARGVPHTYYSRVAWSLLELNAVAPQDRWIDHAVSNCEWVLSQQAANGWFRTAGFRPDSHKAPFTHTIAYTIRGMLECGWALSEPRYVQRACSAVDRIVQSLPSDGRVPGTYSKDWKGNRSFSCLTGNAQLAIVLMKLHQASGAESYWRAAQQINSYLRSKQASARLSPLLDGAIAGSDPCWGKYIRYCFPNWAAKFFADSLMLELDIAARERTDR